MEEWQVGNEKYNRKSEEENKRGKNSRNRDRIFTFTRYFYSLLIFDIHFELSFVVVI